MRMSTKRRNAMSAAIHDTIRDIRIELKLEGKRDFILAQVGNKIWRKQKMALGLEAEG